MTLQVRGITVGSFAENTYFISNDARETLVIDPGDETERILAFIDVHQLKPVAILLTHAHLDHIGSVDVLRTKYAIPVYVHTLEQDFLTDPMLNLSYGRGDIRLQPADVLLSEMGELTVGPFQCRTAHVPGHSPGSTVYIFEADGFAIVGDTIFKGGCGRTDLPTSSSHAELMTGIRQHIVSLPAQTKLFSGHGPVTDVATEIATNPYLNGVTR